MSLNAALVDRARPIRRARSGRRVEGRTVYGNAPGEWFKCRLTLPSAFEDDAAAAGLRPVTVQPTLMTGARDLSHQVIELHNDLRLEVASKQLGTATWEIVGEPAPIRKKRKVIGWEAPIRRVETQDANEEQ